MRRCTKEKIANAISNNARNPLTLDRTTEGHGETLLNCATGGRV